MKDQVDRLVARGVAATYVNSSLDRAQRETRYRQLREGTFDLLYVTPERFRKADFIETLAARRVALLAIDEAHCISQWGHDFRPDYSGVARLREIMGQPTTLCLTATATPAVQQDILVQAGLGSFGDSLEQCQPFVLGIDRPNLALDVEPVWGTDEKLTAIEAAARSWYERGAGTASGIVYFTLIKTLLEFSEHLRDRRIPHVCYHGDLDRTSRRRIQEDFMRGDADLVLATNAFGMGIDKEDIRFVIHADVPGSLEAYYQEIGRAGRDGLESQCLLLYDQRDLATQMEFMKWSNPDADFYCRAYDLMRHEAESIRAFGVEWLHQKLCDRQRHDRRLDTVLAMFQRFGLIDDERDLSSLNITEPLPVHPCQRRRSSSQTTARSTQAVCHGGIRPSRRSSSIPAPILHRRTGLRTHSHSHSHSYSTYIAFLVTEILFLATSTSITLTLVISPTATTSFGSFTNVLASCEM